jgi:uncharacterized protein (TIGR00725 family)
MPIVTFFGSGTVLPDSSQYYNAFIASKILSKNGFDIASGAYFGIMEAALKGASDTKVRRIGITTDFFKEKKPNAYVTELINTDSYLKRLQKLVEIGDAYLIFPGGSGTLLEFSYIWAMKDRGLLNKKLAVCEGKYWHDMIKLLKDNNISDNNKIEHFVDINEALNRIIRYFDTNY